MVADIESTYQRYLGALLDGDGASCSTIVRQLVAGGVDLKALYTQLFTRSLYDVGMLWHEQQISVATEQLATAITERMLSLLQTQLFGGPARTRAIVVSCLEHERHQIGARIIADYCELLGWRGHFLGAKTPLSELLQLLAARRPDLLALSTTIRNLPILLKTLEAVGRASPSLPILVGGQGVGQYDIGVMRDYPNVSCVSTLDQLAERIRLHGP